MKKFFYSIAAAVAGFSFSSIAHAVTISMNVPGTSPNASTTPGAFVANFYQFALMIGGVLAFGVIIYGGVKYMTATGNPSGQSDAKEWIEAALLGLLLLVGAYFILSVINPQLTELSLPPLQALNITSQSTQSSCGNLSCPAGFTPTQATPTQCVCEDAKGVQGCGGAVQGTAQNSCGVGKTCCEVQAKSTDPITYSCFASCLQAPSWSFPTGTASAAPCGNSGLTCNPATQRCCTTNYYLFKNSSCKPLTTSC